MDLINENKSISLSNYQLIVTYNIVDVYILLSARQWYETLDR